MKTKKFRKLMISEAYEWSQNIFESNWIDKRSQENQSNTTENSKKVVTFSFTQRIRSQWYAYWFPRFLLIYKKMYASKIL